MALLLSPRKAARGRGLAIVSRHGDAYGRRVLREMTRRAHDPGAWLVELVERRAKAKGAEADRIDRMFAAMRHSDASITVTLSVYSVPHKRASKLPETAAEFAVWERADERLFRHQITAPDGLPARGTIDVGVAFLAEFDVEVHENKTITDPVIKTYREHGVVRCRPIVSSDRRFITLELQGRHEGAQYPIEVVNGHLPNTKIQIPKMQTRRFRRTMTLPNGGKIAWRLKKEGARTLVVVAQAKLD